jgi:hypothetical protein
MGTQVRVALTKEVLRETCAMRVAGVIAAKPMSSAMTSRRETPGRAAANLVNFEGVDLLKVVTQLAF